MTPALLLAAALALVGYGLVTGGGVAGRVARAVGRGTPARMVWGWAAGTAVAFGLSSFAALLVLGRLDAVAAMPIELRLAAWRLGLPADAAAVAMIAGPLTLGAAIGVAILLLRRRLGRAPIGLRYRSPAAVNGPGEWPAAVALALAAGVGEELFFRLLLPLLIAIVFGAPLAGFALALAAFLALHRHQGPAGVVAVAIVGAALTALYLLTGQIWLAMLVHVAIDLNALVLRPWLTGLTPPAARLSSRGTKGEE